MMVSKLCSSWGVSSVLSKCCCFLTDRDWKPCLVRLRFYPVVFLPLFGLQANHCQYRTFVCCLVFICRVASCMYVFMYVSGICQFLQFVEPMMENDDLLIIMEKFFATKDVTFMWNALLFFLWKYKADYQILK